MSLKTNIENNYHVLGCPFCKSNLYEYTGPRPINPDRAITADMLSPCDEQVPELVPGKPVMCPFCKSKVAGEV